MTTLPASASSEPAPPGAGSISSQQRARLTEHLESARQRGFLGPGPVDTHLNHAVAHAAVLGTIRVQPRTVCDLGSGGGVPGLVIAAGFTEMKLCLVDSMVKRCDFLIAAVASLDWTDRVTVFCGRAEEFARQHREAFDAVTARSLAAPAVTAEIAAGLVGVGGSAVVSSAPNARAHWDDRILALLGFGRIELVIEQGRSFVLLTKTDPCPPEFPRRTGVPTKRPLW